MRVCLLLKQINIFIKMMFKLVFVERWRVLYGWKPTRDIYLAICNWLIRFWINNSFVCVCLSFKQCNIFIKLIKPLSLSMQVRRLIERNACYAVLMNCLSLWLLNEVTQKNNDQFIQTNYILEITNYMIQYFSSTLHHFWNIDQDLLSE